MAQWVMDQDAIVDAMVDQDALEAVLWREGTNRCELWKTDDGSELRVYTSDVLTSREPVRLGTAGLRQAGVLLVRAQAANR